MTGVVTDTGLADVVSALLAQASYVGWGGGSGQGETDTDLAAAFAETRSANMLAAATTNTTGDTLRVTGTIVATAPRTVTEVGVFSDPTAAAMQFYGDFPALTLGTGDSVAFTIDVVVDQA